MPFQGDHEMTKIVELEVAQATLGALIAGLKPDEEVEIVHNYKTVARIVPPKPGTPRFGNCKGMLTIVSDDEATSHFKEQTT